MKFLASLVLGLGVIPLAGAAVSAAPVAKTAVCHEVEDGWKLLELPAKAAANRIERHGDGSPGGPVPGSDDEVFDRGCMPTPEPPGPEPEVSVTFESVCREFAGDVQTGVHSVDGPYVACVLGDPSVGHAALTAQWDPLCISLGGSPRAYFPSRTSVCFIVNSA